MPIVVQCSGCGGKFRAPDEAAGKRLKCPKCATVIHVGNVAQQPTLAARALASSEPKAEKAEWFVKASDGRNYGPMTKSALDRSVCEGRIGVDWLIWTSSWNEWKTAEDVYRELRPQPLRLWGYLIATVVTVPVLAIAHALGASHEAQMVIFVIVFFSVGAAVNSFLRGGSQRGIKAVTAVEQSGPVQAPGPETGKLDTTTSTSVICGSVPITTSVNAAIPTLALGQNATASQSTVSKAVTTGKRLLGGWREGHFIISPEEVNAVLNRPGNFDNVITGKHAIKLFEGWDQIGAGASVGSEYTWYLVLAKGVAVAIRNDRKEIWSLGAETQSTPQY